MPAILFVEDKEGSLRERIRDLEAEAPFYEILSCADPEIALDLLQHRTFQCVVAGFGANTERCSAFLRAARERVPEVIRFALLAAPGDDPMVPPEIEVANQTFSEEISTKELVPALNAAMEVAARSIRAPELNRLLSGFSQLPSAPALYFDLKELLDDPDSDNRQVAKLVSTDPVVCARILKLANSAFYGLPRTVSEIQEAVMYLGTGMISALVLTIHIYRQLPIPGFNIETFWKHSMTVSALARQTARQAGCPAREISAASTAGLLHDMGQLVFLSNLPERYFPLFRQAGNDEHQLVELEEEAFGVDHAELCAHLLSLWQLPDSVVEAVAGHHHPLDIGGGAVTSAPEALRVAEWMMRTALNPPDSDGREAKADLPDIPTDFEPIWRSCLQLVEIGLEKGIPS